MKTLLFLLLGGLFAPAAAAQYRAAGPWRVVVSPVREEIRGEWSSGYVSDFAEALLDTAHYFARAGRPDFSVYFQENPVAATAIAVHLKRNFERVRWDVGPDSITLFLRCNNPLLAPPTRRGQAPIRFAATGATLTLDRAQHLVWVVPSAPGVVLWAYRGRRLVFRHEFKAVPPPLPTIQVYMSGDICDDCRPGENPRTVSMRAIPQRDFLDFLPFDARYRVSQTQVSLMHQGKVEAACTPSQATFQLSEWDTIAQPGDRLLLIVTSAQRQNFRGNIEDVPLEKTFNFPWPGRKVK